MLEFCESLEKLPNLTNWNINTSNIIIQRRMNIIVKTLTGKDLKLEVKTLDSILNVKYMLKDKLGTSPNQICLLYRGRVLEDERTLDSYCIKEGAVLHMVLKVRGCNPVPIYVKYYLAKIEIRVCLFCDDIQKLKELIQNKLDYSPKYQKIIFNGKSLDNECNKLISLGIEENSLLDLNVEYVHKEENICKYQKQIQILHDMGFYWKNIDFKLLDQCLGDISYYFENYYDK